jgi:acetylornithine/succinyldiaminopimelate/putrescine aminotransferase
MFAFEHYDVRPDVITLAKALGGGLPIGAMIAREPVASAFEPGDHASTFGGSALPSAAALATLDVIEQEKLPENAARIGKRLAAGLLEMQADGLPIEDVRERGCMIAVDLARPQAAWVKDECAARGLLINTVGDDMLRLLPPMVLTEREADRGIAILKAVLAAAPQT